MAAKRITERVIAPFAGSQVDREAGVIRGVKLCGLSSENGRDYPPEVFRRDIAKYEGVPIYLDHSRERSVDRKFGWISAPRVDADGTPRGDAHLLKNHPTYPQVMEAAERNPNLLGFSHVALCPTSRGANGRERVEGLEKVESVDLVPEPASVGGLFEGRTVAGKISLKQFSERFGPKWGPARWHAFTKLCEDYSGMADAPVMDEPAPVADPGADTGDMKAALMAALAPLLDEAFDSGDSTKVVAALKDFVKLHAKHTGKEVKADAQPDGMAAGEGKKAQSDALVEAIKYLAPELSADLSLIAATPPEHRKAQADRLRELVALKAERKGAEKPQSAGGTPFLESKPKAEKTTEAAGTGGTGTPGANGLPWLS